MVDYFLNNIDAKKSKFKKTTDKYKKDSTYDIIDIEEAINKNKFILKCPKESFIYLDHLVKEKKKVPQINLKEYYFEKDNGTIENFADFFEVISVLGSGAFGTVIQAHDIVHKKEVAIKIISKNQYKNKNDVLYTEIYNQRNFNHKNIVKLHYIKENHNYFFLVQELMQESLRQLIIRRYTNNEEYLFRDEECAVIMRNLLEGMNYIHNKNVIHRDIKPENIMFSNVNDLNSLKICDFGVSTTMNELEQERDSICGTLIYMAPEIFKKQANETSDIWAAGFILFILCSGGMHPLLKPDMKKEEYKVKLQSIKEWDLPSRFPILAKNLFFKLCKLEKHYRYEIQRALYHPWISRLKDSSIPLNQFEKISQNEGKLNLRLMLKSLIFLQAYKKINLRPLEKVNTIESCKISTNLRKVPNNPQISKTVISNKQKGPLIDLSKKPLVSKDKPGINNFLGLEVKKVPSKSSEKEEKSKNYLNARPKIGK